MKASEQIKIAKAKSLLNNPGGVDGISFVKNDEVAELPKLIERLEALIEEGNQIAGDNQQALADIDIKDYESELADLASKIVTTREAIEAIEIPDNSEMMTRIKKLDEAIEAIEIPDLSSIKLPAPIVKVKTNDDDIYARYSFSDYKVESDGEYSGYLSADGRWFIQRIAMPSEGETMSRFVAGDKNYRQAWRSRRRLSYDYRDRVDIT